jgi:3-hydroxyisobutyrate dehydrogenase
MSAQPVAVLGTGAMGHAVAQRLLATGHAVRVWNRTPARAASLRGAHLAASPAEAIEGCGVVLVSLADDGALRDLLAGPYGLARALRPRQVLLELGTVTPATIRELAPEVRASGASFLDVGMLGNATHAGQGELRFYVGGSEPDVRHVTGFLGHLGKEVVHVGELGSGMALKLVLNLVMGLEMQALAEAAALGEGLGLDRRRVLEAVADSGFASAVMRFKSRRMVKRDYSRPDFRLALMTKDLLLADRSAREGGLDLPMTRAATETHVHAALGDSAGQDCAAIAEAVRASAAVTSGSSS